MRTRRPPLAEIDAWVLWQAIRQGDWAAARPWLLLLAGFCAVLAGVASFFWLTARTDTVFMIALLFGLLLFAVYLSERLSKRRAFAQATVAVLLLAAGLVFVLWLLIFWAAREDVWIGFLGVLIECGLGVTLGLAGINRLDPQQ